MIGAHRIVLAFALTVLDMLRFAAIGKVRKHSPQRKDLPKSSNHERACIGTVPRILETAWEAVLVLYFLSSSIFQMLSGFRLKSPAGMTEYGDSLHSSID